MSDFGENTPEHEDNRPVWKDAAVVSPLRLLGRRAGPVGIALTAYDVWRRIPPAQRKQLLEATRKQAPRAAAAMVRYWGARRRSRL
jgi:hypothetical protein